MTNHQLIQTICTLAPHGLQVQYKNGQILKINPKNFNYDSKNEEVAIRLAIQDVEKRHAKLLLHSTSKLTEPILEGGKVPIVELLKIKYKGWFERHYDNRYSETDIEICPSYIKAYVKYHAPHSIEIWLNEIENTPTWITNYLIENHFNPFNLSDEYFTEKSTLKN